jgi:hypothetical protein
MLLEGFVVLIADTVMMAIRALAGKAGAIYGAGLAVFSR